ncbi:Prickle-like protein 2 [Mactra antiquata]
MAANQMFYRPSCGEMKSMVSSDKPRCLKCGDRCPGLDLHYWRKICKHCRCGPEDHDLTDDDDREKQPIKFQIGDGHSNPRDLSSRLHKLNIDDPTVQTEIVTPENDLVIHRIVAENLRSQTYISMLPKDKQLFAAQLRRRQLQRQLPLHDLHAKFCDSMTDKELQKFQKFAEKRKNKAVGIGNVGAIPENAVVRCHRCDLTMDSKSFAMITNRMGSSVCFHTGCFTCASCKELLVDNIYFFRNDDIYCGRHYAELIYPRCSACDEIIFAREYTQAENQCWHVQHFCCWYCDTPLAGLRYIAQQNNPYCVQCFDRLYSKVCNTCSKIITADSPGLSHGEYHWHACPHCFCCHCCGKNLINHQFLLKDGKLFCSMSCRQTFTNSPNSCTRSVFNHHH